jgi:hypothetical protein
MARTSFSGPVKSDNGFEGNITGNITGSVTGAVAATTLSASGAVVFSALPTSNPTVAGQLWNDGGTIKVSAG